jgi:hypothetical protein
MLKALNSSKPLSTRLRGARTGHPPIGLTLLFVRAYSVAWQVMTPASYATLNGMQQLPPARESFPMDTQDKYPFINEYEFATLIP